MNIRGVAYVSIVDYPVDQLHDHTVRFGYFFFLFKLLFGIEPSDDIGDRIDIVSRLVEVIDEFQYIVV